MTLRAVVSDVKSSKISKRSVAKKVSKETVLDGTSTERSDAKIGNTIQSSRNKETVQYVHWFFTFNNYNEDSIKILEMRFRDLCKKYVFQEEKGLEGTNHLQGSIHLKKRMRWTEFNLPKEIHWEKTNNVNRADDYCQKVNSRNGKIYKWGFPVDLKIIDNLRPWQESVKMSCLDSPDDRTINWVYDVNGCAGKTVFCKYMAATNDAIILTGGGVKDIACQIALLKKAGRDLNKLTTFIFNFGRSCENISYVSIEGVKDGLITSSKYESETLIFNCPHIWIFSNELPEFDKLSKDRWKLFTIVNDELLINDLNKFDCI